MALELLGHIELPESLKPGGFDHAAVHYGSGRLYGLGFDAERDKVYSFLPKTHRAGVYVDTA